MTREQAGAFLDGFDDDGLTKLISELMWFQVTHKGMRESGGGGHVAALRKLMAGAAREHVIDMLTGEPATDPLAGRAQ